VSGENRVLTTNCSLISPIPKLWTAKEAYLKALGTGISGGLDRVEVGLNPLKLDNVAGEWQLWTAAIGDNYRATVVIEGSDRVIKTFGLSDL